MKKILAILLAIVLLVSITACDKGGAPTEPATDTTAGSAQETPTAENTDPTQESVNNTETSAPTETTAPTENMPQESDPTGGEENKETTATEPTQPTGQTTNPTAPTGQDTKPTEPPAPTAPSVNSTDPTENTAAPTTKPSQTHKHSYKSAVTKATCVAGGYTTYTCECGHSYVGDKTQAAGHNYGQWKITKEPTATETGMKVRSCSACDHREQSTIGKISSSHIHSYVTKVTPPTCAAEGYTTYTCECGESYVKDKVHKLPHDLKSTHTPNTCTEAGKSVYTCTKCSYVDERIWEPTGHDFRVNEHPASCENYGVRREQCVNCALSKPEIITPATGHNCNFTEVKKATCTTAGTRTGVCKTCHKTVTEETSPATGHVNTRLEVISTCSPFVKSCEKTICKDCDAVLSTVEKEPLPHKPTVTVNLGAACQTLCDQGNRFYIDYNNSKMYNYDQCTHYTDWMVEACPECNFIFPETAYFIYTQQEAAEIMLDYLNEFRAQHFGSHAYDVTLSDYLMTYCNHELNRGPKPQGNFYVNGLEEIEEIAMVDFACNLKDQFREWTEHNDIRSFLLSKEVKYFGFAYRENVEVDAHLPTRVIFAKDATP